MDEDISIINANSRNEKIKKFFFKNKKKLISLLIIITLSFLGIFGYEEYKNRKKIQISDEFNSLILNYNKDNKEITTNKLINLINKKNPTYSTLSLYFILDNKLILETKTINELFDILIEKTSLQKEVRNLVIFKKALYNADKSDEGMLLNMLNSVINSNSVWKSHALHLIGEFFYSKKEEQKAKEFFKQIIDLKEANQSIKQQAQIRLNRDLSE